MKKSYVFLICCIISYMASCTKDSQLLRNDEFNNTNSTSIDSTASTSTDSAITTTSTDSTITTSTSKDPSTIKAEILDLFHTTGRTSQNSLNSATGSLPSGVSLNGANITINADDVLLEDYDLRDYTIFLNSDNVIIKNCLLGEKLAPRDGKRVVDIKANVKNFIIEDNDFVGYKGLGYGVGSAIFQRSLTSTENGIGGIIRKNSFKHFGQDCVKTAGGVLIEENIFFASSNVETIPSGIWNATTTYALNEVVKDPHGGQKHFISLVANNVNNSPPTQHNTSDANWQFFDPHYDIVNPFENTIPSTIRRNLFLTNTQDPMIDQADRSYAVGIVNALRLIRNNTAAPTNYASLLVEENVIIGSAVYGFGYPIQAANTGGLWTNPTIDNNLIDANNSGKYTHPSTASAVDWLNNFDATTLTQINP